MKTIIQQLPEGYLLNREEAYDCIQEINRGNVSDAQLVALICGLQVRGLQLEELSGFRDALMELALPVKLDCDKAIDVCGTGGDGKNTFNISTTTAFVLAGMGYKVIKHGNHGVSSFCGSSTVLEALGYRFTSEPDELQRQLDRTNICFLHAPLFHPVLQRVAPLRKALGVPTFFNSMGPLINPAQPTLQLTGTYSMELARNYLHLLREQRNRYTVVYGLDGYDELTFIGSTRVFGNSRDELILTPPDGKKILPEDIESATSVDTAAAILLNILRGKGNAAQNCVVAGNTALALQLFHPELSFQSAYESALEFILSGNAIQYVQPS